jgi:hypothetical protein
MKTRTKDEIVRFGKKTWGTHPDVTVWKNGMVKLAPRSDSFKLTDMLAVAEFFGTMNIDIEGTTEGNGGCETCYFESAVIELRIRPEQEAT